MARANFSLAKISAPWKWIFAVALSIARRDEGGREKTKQKKKWKQILWCNKRNNESESREDEVPNLMDKFRGCALG